MQIWPETYSYTVNEAVSAGLPILSLDMGAGAERVKQYDLGWVLPSDATSAQILEKLVEIKNDTEGYNRAVNSVRSYEFKTVSQMGEEYDAIYDTESAPKAVGCAVLREIIIEEKKFYNRMPVSYNTDAQNVLNEVLTSAKWRVVNKIKVPKFISKPLKAIFRVIKRILKR